jgi:antitoxin component YwqK of YwqJK toxin-antitoxin module
MTIVETLDKVRSGPADPILGRSLSVPIRDESIPPRVENIQRLCTLMNVKNNKWKCVAVIVGTSWMASLTTSGRVVGEAAQEHGVAHKSSPIAIELVRERYPDGRINIEREVTSDVAGNYVNHGAWRMWNADDQLVTQGRYEMGLRTGRWMRRFNREDAAVLNTAPFNQFEAPFVARASFQADTLNGEWIIVDAEDRKCSCVTLKHGKRNGPATLWLPDGSLYREAIYRNGAPVGDFRQMDDHGRLNTVATFVGGRQLVNKVMYFPESQIKQFEANCLVATIIEVAPDDFWVMRFAEYEAQNEELRHGGWKSWHSNGKLQAAGFFQYDREMGEFAWWHANGQEAVKGGYVDGLPDGGWTWWHANGQKAAEGHYHSGGRVGVWQRWAEDGRLVNRTTMQPAVVAGGRVTTANPAYAPGR